MKCALTEECQKGNGQISYGRTEFAHILSGRNKNFPSTSVMASCATLTKLTSPVVFYLHVCLLDVHVTMSDVSKDPNKSNGYHRCGQQ